MKSTLVDKIKRKSIKINKLLNNNCQNKHCKYCLDNVKRIKNEMNNVKFTKKICRKKCKIL